MEYARAPAALTVRWTTHGVGLAAPAQAPVLHTLSGQTMGTTWSVKLAASAYLPTAPLHRAIQRALDAVVAQMSNWDADSDVGRFNRAPAGSWHELPPEFARVLATALRLAERTDGACDPTVGPLVELWGFGPAGRRASVPSDADVEAVMARTGWRRLQRDAEGRLLQPGGVGIDLCGIAKGFGVDRVVEVLADAGIGHCLVEVGGELRASGRRPNGQPWRIAVEAPQAGAGQAAVLALHDMAVATSGDRWHFFEHDGQRHSHTLDPRTGRPVRHGLASVTVLHPECMRADALATALTVLGPVDGMRHAQQHGLAAMFVRRTADGALERQMSEAFEVAMAEHPTPHTDSTPDVSPRPAGDRS